MITDQSLVIVIDYSLVIVIDHSMVIGIDCNSCQSKSWIDKSISLSSKIRLMCPPATSIFLYACESWTLTAELQRIIQSMEMRCNCTILHISQKDHVTNEEVCAKIQRQSYHTKTS